MVGERRGMSLWKLKRWLKRRKIELHTAIEDAYKRGDQEKARKKIARLNAYNKVLEKVKKLEKGGK